MNTSSEKKQTEAITVIDVRTPAEFASGHVAGSINIPLQELQLQISRIKEMKRIVLCCASGARSGMAEAILKQHGIACSNGGPWTEVNYKLSVNYYD